MTAMNLCCVAEICFCLKVARVRVSMSLSMRVHAFTRRDARSRVSTDNEQRKRSGAAGMLCFFFQLVCRWGAAQKSGPAFVAIDRPPREVCAEAKRLVG